MSLPAIQIMSYRAWPMWKIFGKPVILPKTQKIKERPWQTKPRSTCDCDMVQQITRTLPHAVRVPRVIYRPQALNLCMSREYKTSKSNLGNWKRMEGEIDLATSNLEFHVSGPVLNWNCMKLDEVGTSRESCPSSSFRRFEPFTAQNTPRASFATVFSVLSSLVSSDSLW